MPRRNDLESILIIGSGPIVIGQACEFDYSGTQAIKALKQDGYRVILVNSNPATIMTDPEFADRTYIEPITAEYLEEIIRVERPDAVLPTMGGQTALNIALELDLRGVFERYGVELIGAKVDSIRLAEDRESFRQAMEDIGLESAKSGIAHSIKEAEQVVAEIGYPIILRPSRTLGGTGGSIVDNPSELSAKVGKALSASPIREVLIEESLVGWKEIELEVMRDSKDNVVIICGIENIDPMGVHTGDSITVAPIQTLRDKEYQILRDASKRIMRRIGVDAGGSNVQFALNPKTGRLVVIEMNPRVSRSSALASKATGFPIAKIAAKLAVGYTLDEIPNDITKKTPSCFEPSIDYVVVKIPRFNFEKFPSGDRNLGPQMKSVGEVLSFGRCFSEALQKAMCSLELSTVGFDRSVLVKDLGKAEILDHAKIPSAQRLWFVGESLRVGYNVDEVFKATAIDPWFLSEIQTIIETEEELKGRKLEELNPQSLLLLKRDGFSDKRIAELFQSTESEIAQLRKHNGITASFRSVDTCAGEFEAQTSYLYSSYDFTEDSPPSMRKKVMILGSGPNRIGQGIEFDYCCVHAVFALKEEGFETIMVNCNPETVSTDYDISDRLYFEPLTFESVMQIIERERPEGVIVQFGGQTPLKLANTLNEAGVPILGTSVDSIDIAEDRKRFSALINRLGLQQPKGGTAASLEDALLTAGQVGFPLMIRPSFVLGGRAMRVVQNQEELRNYIEEGVEVSNDRPVLIDSFLQNAIEVDIDAVSDGRTVVIAGVMEHIERAGIHSGDSSCTIPPPTLANSIIEEMKRQTKLIALELRVVGLLNVQFAVTQDKEIYILEANPRASRTVPFVSKASGVPWAKIAAKLMAGRTLKDLNINEQERLPYYAVKACVFPFNRFPGVDILLGPEMKSTGEVMGIHQSFAGGVAKSQAATQNLLPTEGLAFLSVRKADKNEELVKIAKELRAFGFSLCATKGTAAYLGAAGIHVSSINKVREGSPHIVDLLGSGEVGLVINTPEGANPFLDSRSIRFVANEMRVLTYTTLAAASAAVQAIGILRKTRTLGVKALQEYHDLFAKKRTV